MFKLYEQGNSTLFDYTHEKYDRHHQAVMEDFHERLSQKIQRDPLPEGFTEEQRWPFLSTLFECEDTEYATWLIDNGLATPELLAKVAVSIGLGYVDREVLIRIGDVTLLCQTAHKSGKYSNKVLDALAGAALMQDQYARWYDDETINFMLEANWKVREIIEQQH